LLWLGLNAWTLGPVANVLTIMPQGYYITV
jgi:hypothetical protein